MRSDPASVLDVPQLGGDFLESLLNELSDGVLVTDAHRRVVLINRVFAELLGGPCCTVLERGFNVWLAGIDQDAELRWTGMERKVLTEGFCGGVEFTWAHGGRPLTWRVDGTRVQVPGMGRPCIVTLWHNVTAYRDVEQRLQRALDDANTARRALATACDEAQDLQRRAEEASCAKTAFLANMSHEIRTPMNGVLSMLDLALDEEPDATLRQYLQTAKSCATGLLGVINDILDLSKIEAGKLDVEIRECSVRELLQGLHRQMTPRAAEKGLAFGIHLETPVPAVIHTDAIRVHQCLINLVSNAIKFTEEGTVTVHVNGEHREQGPCLCFGVEDTGIGIAPADQDSIFRAFEQADVSTTRRFGGSGLGLAITRHLADLLHGDLSLSSREGRGSTFTLAIPTGVSEPRVQLTGEQWREAGPRSHTPLDRCFRGQVLVVEDDPANQLAVRLILKKCGLDVVVASDGAEAVARAQERPFDLIFMDVQMPTMNGYEATHALRSLGLRVPVYALTAHAMRSDVERSLRAGCDGHLTKPVDRRALLEVLARHLTAVPASHGSAPGATTVAPGAAESVPIDWDDLCRRLEDEDLILASIAEWLRHAPAHLGDLTTAFDTGDLEPVRAAAHALKGSAATVGARRLSRAAGAVEVAARSGSLETARGLLAQVEFELTAVQSFLSRPDWRERAQKAEP